MEVATFSVPSSNQIWAHSQSSDLNYMLCPWNEALLSAAFTSSYAWDFTAQPLRLRAHYQSFVQVRRSVRNGSQEHCKVERHSREKPRRNLAQILVTTHMGLKRNEMHASVSLTASMARANGVWHSGTSEMFRQGAPGIGRKLSKRSLTLHLHKAPHWQHQLCAACWGTKKTSSWWEGGWFEQAIKMIHNITTSTYHDWCVTWDANCTEHHTQMSSANTQLLEYSVACENLAMTLSKSWRQLYN